MKKLMISAGDSEMRANCFVTVLKYTGVTSDVTDIRNIINPDKMMDNLRNKSQIADFVCSPYGCIVILLVVCFIFALCCVCLKRCCCTPKLVRIHMEPTLLHSKHAKMPYVRMDDV